MSVTKFLVPSAEDMFADVEIHIVDAAPNVLMLIGEGGNIGVSCGSDGVLMVDAQFAPLTDRILAAVRTRTEGPLKLLVNTHWHQDHVGGNGNMKAQGALIAAHRNTRSRMCTEQFMGAVGSRVPASPPAALPDFTFTDTLTCHWNGDQINIFHAASAHTDGDVIVHFGQANVVQMGDTYFNGMYPFVDIDTGGSIDGMIAAADRVLALSDEATRIIPGHGALSDWTELQAYRNMMSGIRDAVANLIARGYSKEAIIAARPAARYDAVWGGGLLDADTFVDHVTTSLQGQ